MEQNTNETLDLLMRRKSVRVFEDREIAEADRRRILEASLRAATAGNMTLYTIIDVKEQKLKDRLAVTCDNQPFIATAPLVLVYCADYRRWYQAFCQVEEVVRKPSYGDFLLAAEDTIIAAQTAVTAADALGLGTCNIGDILENYEEHRRLLGLPDYVAPVAMVVGGYPTAQQAARKQTPRFALEDIVHENRYDLQKSDNMLRMLEDKENWHGEELERRLRAFCERKWNCSFSEEMSRSVKAMLDAWACTGGQQ